MPAILRLTKFVVTFGLVSLACTAGAAPLLELKVGNDTFTGKSLAHDDEVCWLARVDGRVTEVPLEDVTSFRKVSGQFRGVNSVELRSRLRREFGADWEVVSTSHYLVCAPRGRAPLFARTFEDLYRSFRSYFSRRGFELPQPDYPMVAVIYPTPAAFAANCKKDGVPFVAGLKGYYHRLTNRVSLYEDDVDRLAFLAPGRISGEGLTIASGCRRRSALSLGATPSGTASRPRWDASIQSDLKDTIVHEATHQVAYNLGLHSRIGENPKWITEGLATLFESEGARRNKGSSQPRERLNPERFEWFSAYARKGRRPKSLASFITRDRMFQRSPLDAYAQAWALMFYLAETRSSQYTQFLTAVSSRPPLKPYSAEERLTDFQDAFGNDIDRLEVAFLRFMDNLQH